MHWTSIPSRGGLVIFLLAFCYRNQVWFLPSWHSVLAHCLPFKLTHHKSSCHTCQANSTGLHDMFLTPPQSSLSLLLILAREVRPRGSTRGDGKEERGVTSSYFPPPLALLYSVFIPHIHLPHLAKRDDRGRVRACITLRNDSSFLKFLLLIVSCP